MVEKAPTEKMGDIMVPQIHFKRTQNSGFFFVKADTHSQFVLSIVLWGLQHNVL